ncbi:MAG TPA: hypothetical protein VMS17_24375 [Gemmataceae bacterium]|nr:hypothetical protein [Gemmataceae bacterium]
MFEQAIKNLRQPTEETIHFQQDLLKKWIDLWAPPPAPPEVLSPASLQKKWAEVVVELIKNHRESLETHFSARLKNIEEAFHLAQAKDAEELRAKTIELWKKAFDGQRQLYEAHLRVFQAAVAKWSELATLARPKSRIFTCPFGISIRLLGLMSQ